MREIKYRGKSYVNLGDFHTHTIYSMHGMSSPTEMVDAAIDAGLAYIAITDHHMPKDSGIGSLYNPSYTIMKNQICRPGEYIRSLIPIFDKVKVIPGYEYNVFTEPDDEIMDTNHLKMVGIHSWYGNQEVLSRNAFLEGIMDSIQSGKYQIFVHPERELDFVNGYIGSERLDRDKEYYPEFYKEVLDTIVSLCKEENMLLEVNASSFSGDTLRHKGNIERAKYWLGRAKELNMDVIVSSDAHSKYLVGASSEAFWLLEEMEYPANHIVNFDIDKVINMIAKTGLGTSIYL